ncbi:hypothetical protein D3C73_1507640 [compost metagenome]
MQAVAATVADQIGAEQQGTALLADFDGGLVCAEDQVALDPCHRLSAQADATVVVDAAQLVVDQADLAVAYVDGVLL